MPKLKEFFKFNKNKLVTVIIGVLFGLGSMFLSHWYYGFSLEVSLKSLFIIEFLIAVAYIDYIKMIIPNKLLIFGFFSYFIFLAYEAIAYNYEILELLKVSGLGLLMGGGAFAFCSLISKGGIGMGDIKLFSVLGILLGWQATFNVIFFSVLFVAVYGVYRVVRKKDSKKSSIPVGPFALFGMITGVCLGMGGMMT